MRVSLTSPLEAGTLGSLDGKSVRGPEIKQARESLTLYPRDLPGERETWDFDTEFPSSSLLMLAILSNDCVIENASTGLVAGAETQGYHLSTDSPNH